MNLQSDDKLVKQLNYITANIFRCYIAVELFLYPLKKNPPLNVAYEYIFHQLIFLESFYIHVRKLTEPKNRDRCSIDTLCKNIIDSNSSKFDKIKSAINQLVEMLQNIRENKIARDIREIRDYFAHSIPNNLSDLQVSYEHVLEVKKNLDNITNIIKTIYTMIFNEETSIDQYHQIAQCYAERFWNTLAIGTAILNPDFEEYQNKLDKCIENMKRICHNT